MTRGKIERSAPITVKGKSGEKERARIARKGKKKKEKTKKKEMTIEQVGNNACKVIYGDVEWILVKTPIKPSLLLFF